MAKKKTAKKRVAKKSVKKAAARKSTKTTSRRTSSGASKKGTKRAAPKAKTATAKRARTQVAKKTVAKKTVAKKTTATAASSRKKSGTVQASAKKATKPARAASQKKNSTGVDKPADTNATATAAPQISLMAKGASVIRVRSNAKPNRRGKNDAASNHKAKGATATTHDPIQFPEEARKLPKTPLKAKELREFRALLYLKRAELCGDVERLTDEAFHSDREVGSTERSNMPIHMADLGSDNWEQDFTLGLIDTERHLVAEIDAALARIDNKTYGICLATHNPISVARLRAKPWAKYCIEYARAREEGRA